jgi:hypothetical protein
MQITLQTPEILTIIGGLFLLLTVAISLTKYIVTEQNKQSTIEESVSKLLAWSEEAKKAMVQTNSNVNQLTESVKHLTELFHHEVLPKSTPKRKTAVHGS